MIEAEATSAATVERTIAILRRLGKTPVHVRRDLPGFVGNRLQHALRREALARRAAVAARLTEALGSREKSPPPDVSQTAGR